MTGNGWADVAVELEVLVAVGIRSERTRLAWTENVQGEVSSTLRIGLRAAGVRRTRGSNVVAGETWSVKGGGDD